VEPQPDAVLREDVQRVLAESQRPAPDAFLLHSDRRGVGRPAGALGRDHGEQSRRNPTLRGHRRRTRLVDRTVQDVERAIRTRHPRAEHQRHDLLPAANHPRDVGDGGELRCRPRSSGADHPRRRSIVGPRRGRLAGSCGLGQVSRRARQRSRRLRG
jgi:hypothetical protein